MCFYRVKSTIFVKNTIFLEISKYCYRDSIVYIIGNGFMDEVIDKLIKFQEQRDWKKFHTPENLAKSISIEAAELLEHFQWGKEYDSSEVADELADVLIYCIYMADAMDFDIEEIISDKIKKNTVKYPVLKSKGNAKKYTEL